MGYLFVTVYKSIFFISLLAFGAESEPLEEIINFADDIDKANGLK